MFSLFTDGTIVDGKKKKFATLYFFSRAGGREMLIVTVDSDRLTISRAARSFYEAFGEETAATARIVANEICQRRRNRR